MTPLIYIEPARNYYARYEAHRCTAAVESSVPLTQDQVERFRQDDRAMIDEYSPTAPEAA